MGITTKEEQTAVAESGQVDKTGFNQESEDAKDGDVFAIEELATLYVALGGTDDRAMAVIKAGQKAGRIDASGNYVGPSTDTGLDD